MVIDREKILASCPLCGKPVCSRCSKGGMKAKSTESHESKLLLCPRCLRTISTTTSPSLQEQFKDRKKQEFQRNRRKKGWILTFLFPGLGHLIIGSTVKGIIIGFFGILIWGTFLRIHPIILTPPNPGFFPFPLVLFVVILYVLTFRSIQRTLQRMEEAVPELEEKQLPKKRTTFAEARLKEEKLKHKAY